MKIIRILVFGKLKRKGLCTQMHSIEHLQWWNFRAKRKSEKQNENYWHLVRMFKFGKGHISINPNGVGVAFSKTKNMYYRILCWYIPYTHEIMLIYDYILLSNANMRKSGFYLWFETFSKTLLFTTKRI